MSSSLAASYAEGKLVARDTFARTTTANLGTANLGGKYSGSTGATQLSTKDGQGVIANLRPNQGAEQYLPDSSALNAQMQTTFHVAAVNNSTIGLRLSNEFRRQSNGDRYDVRVMLYANGQVNLNAVGYNHGVQRRIGTEIKVLTAASNHNLVEQARVVGTQPAVLMARVWPQGAAVPNWQFVATDSDSSALATPGPLGLDFSEAANGTVSRYAFADLYAWVLDAPASKPPTTSTTPSSSTASSPNSTTSSTAPTKPASPTAPATSSSSTAATPPSTPSEGSTVSSDAASNLDPSGRSIPDTDYPIPTGAIFMSTTGSPSAAGTHTAPVSTLNSAIDKVPSGGTIVVESGVYRDWYNNGAGNYKIFGKGFTLQAAPHATVWFDGSDVEPGNKWASDGNGHWSMNWSTPSFCDGGYYEYAYNKQPTSNSGPCSHFDMTSSTYPAAVDPQMVFVNGTQLTEVASLSQVTAGTFYYAEDLANKSGRMYIGANPSSSSVEVSARPVALVTGASDFNIKGVGFRRYATSEYNNTTTGAVFDCCGSNMLVQDSVFTQNANMGLAMVAKNGVVEHSVFAYNGGQGVGSNGHENSSGAHDGLVFDSNVVAYNTTAHMGEECTISCDQSGFKMAHMNGFTISNNIFEYNSGGPGVWCDEACSGGKYIYNVAHDNKTGILDEVSSTDMIASNALYSNQEYGLRVCSYGDEIYNNTMANNGTDDLWIYDDPRNAQNLQGTQVGPDTNSLKVANNVMSGGGSNGIARFQRSNGQTNTGPNTWFVILDYNTYYRSSATASLVDWIDSSNAGNYTSLAILQKAHGLETHGQDLTGSTSPTQLGQPVASRASASTTAPGTNLPTDIAAALDVPASAGTKRGVISYPGI